MTADILFSQDAEPFDWSEAETAKDSFGTKGALLATLPRPWIPPFALVSAALTSQLTVLNEIQKPGNETVARLKALAGTDGKAGGFDDGLVLLQTGILGSRKETIQDSLRLPTQVLARRVSEDTYEIPFSFFGFMELDQPRSLSFEHLGTYLTIVLKNDRLEIRAVKTPEQLELPLDLSIEQDSSES